MTHQIDKIGIGIGAFGVDYKIMERLEFFKPHDIKRNLEVLNHLLKEFMEFLSQFDKEILDLYLENEKEDEVSQLLEHSLQLACTDD